MFDLRYHVASLAAVFLALVIGILVGVGIADRGLVDKANTHLLEQEVSSLRARLNQASQQSALSAREQAAAQSYIKETYPSLVHNRLRGKRVALVFVGKENAGLRSTIEQALTAAGALQVRLRTLKMPVDAQQLDAQLAGQAGDQEYIGKTKLETLGKALGDELVNGGDTPLWNTLTESLVEYQEGGSKQPVDGVIVVRTVRPQRDGTSRFLFGLYEGMSSQGIPAVGVEPTDVASSAVGVFRSAGLSSVDDIDKPAGRLALVLLLADAPSGQYGLKKTADAVLPAFPSAAR
jgi:Copper transport outer membrane protein, MctB